MRSSLRHWLAFAAAALPARADFTSSLCPGVPLSADDFAVTELFDKQGAGQAARDSALSEPVHMDVRVVNDESGKYDHSDIVFVQRTGDMKWYDGAAKAVKLMGHIDVHSGPGSQGDNGLMGVALDPAFEANRYLYAWYSPAQTVYPNLQPGGQNRQLRLSRFTVKSDYALDMASEKILINILGNRTDNWNSGGPMQFDAYGDLWVAVGTNGSDVDPAACDLGGNVLSPTDSLQSAEWGASDTHSLRGGFFRIHPDSSPKGYSIPMGNFGEYWADQYAMQGLFSLSSQYRDTSKVLPEVYVKGERSNFSVAVHPSKRWLAWGSSNYGSSFDEFNIVSHPAFAGFPYFHGDNLRVCDNGKNANAPLNTSPLNSGITDLPPAVPGAINGLTNVAIGGPIYAFDPSLDNDFKFPPHFDDTWLMAGFDGGLWGVKVDSTGSVPHAEGAPVKLDGEGIFKHLPIRNFIQGMYGKDGALYILNYDGAPYQSGVNPGAFRVTYKGACRVPVAAKRMRPTLPDIRIDPMGIAVTESGPHVVSLYDLDGRRVWSDQGIGSRTYRLGDIRSHGGIRAGIYLALVRTPNGEYSRPISLF
jgi:cytochrome c